MSILREHVEGVARRLDPMFFNGAFRGTRPLDDVVAEFDGLGPVSRERVRAVLLEIREQHLLAPILEVHKGTHNQWSAKKVVQGLARARERGQPEVISCINAAEHLQPFCPMWNMDAPETIGDDPEGWFLARFGQATLDRLVEEFRLLRDLHGS